MNWFEEFLDTVREQTQELRKITRDMARAAQSAAAVAEFNQRAEETFIPVLLGARFSTDTGRVFQAVAYRQVRENEYHFCHGTIWLNGPGSTAEFFPGIEQHHCYILVEIPTFHQQQAPPRPAPPADREKQIWRALRSLGFKKSDGEPDPADVRARYLDMAKRYHPDRNPRGAERMKQITEAYRNYQKLKIGAPNIG